MASEPPAPLVPAGRALAEVASRCEFCDQPAVSRCARCQRRQCRGHTTAANVRCEPCENDYSSLINADTDARRMRTVWCVLSPVVLGFAILPWAVGWGCVFALLGPLVGLFLRGTVFRFRLDRREGFERETKAPALPAARARLRLPGEVD